MNIRGLHKANTLENRKRVLLVAATTGYQTRAFGETAARLDIELVMATDRCHVLGDPWADQAIPIRFEQPYESAKTLSKLKVNGVLALGDRPAWIAALAAEALGVPFHQPAAAHTASDKSLAREKFRSAGMLVAESYLISISEKLEAARFYPCVMKPLGLSASRGVIRANNSAEFQAAFTRIRSILNRPEILRLDEERDRWIQVERFIEGREFALEGLVTHGCLQVLAIFDKPDPLNGPFFEETIYITPSRETRRIQDLIEKAAASAVRAIGLQHGPVHAEMRVNSDGVFVLEVAARPIGGLCSRVLKFPDGNSLEELILRHATGQKVSHSRAEAAGVMMIPIPRGGIYQHVSGVKEARSVQGILDVIITAKIGQELLPLPEGASYLGFIFAQGNEAETALRSAYSKLSFSISGTLPIST